MGGLGMGALAMGPRRKPLEAPGHSRQTAMLELQGIRHSYQLGGRTLPVLRGVDVRVQSGELVAIVGRSGSGKSTLLHVAGGLAAPDEGEVRLGGEVLSTMGPRGRAVARRKRVGFVFQAFHLMPGLTVAENVALPLLLDGEPRGRAIGRALPVLRDVGLGDRAQHLPGELSGGELQRAAIARALVAEPDLVLADEPTGNLDSVTADEVMDMLIARVREAALAMVLVTHDPLIAARADRVLTMVDGLIA
jgi:putative ABC transport system ATP-binding protein